MLIEINHDVYFDEALGKRFEATLSDKGGHYLPAADPKRLIPRYMVLVVVKLWVR